MGKKLDALFGRSSFKSSKFKRYVNLVVSRIALLKIQHHVRWSQARSDVVHLISLGHQESALLRVEHVIREQNMLDVFAIIEGYCRLLIERVLLIESTKACPDELKEAISSLIFVASRFVQLPELRKIRGLFTSKFGKQFATCATELRNDCGVNPNMVKKLPIRRPSLGTRIKVLKEIAAENDVTLCIEGESSEPTEAREQQRENNCRDLATITDPKLDDDDAQNLPIDINHDKRFSNVMKSSKKYTDVAMAAQEAFELAAHAAIAAKAAVELSQLKLCEKDHVDPNTSNHQQKNMSDLGGLFKSCLQVDDDATPNEIDYNKSENQVVQETNNISSSSSSGSSFDEVNEREKSLFSIILGQNQELGNEFGFDGKEEEKAKSSFSFIDVSRGNKVENHLGDKEEVVETQSPKWFPWKDQNELEAYSFEARTLSKTTHLSDSEENSQHSNRGRRPLSVRTKRMRRPFW